MRAASIPENKNPAAPIQVNGWKLALDRAPLFMSVLLLFILPFITQPDSADPIEVKALLAQIVVFLMLGAWALKVYLSGQWTAVYTTSFIPLLLLVIWIAGTLFFSPFASVGRHSFFSDLYLPLWYLLLTQTCVEVWRAENLIITFLMAAFGTSLWAIAQALGFDHGVWGTIVAQSFQGRVTAGLGNPEFLAGFLLTAWPLALALLLRASSKSAKFLWAMILVTAWIALVLAQSKAGWLGGVVGLVTFAFFYFWKSQDILLARRWFIGLALLLVILTLATPLKNRLSGLLDPQNESIQFREQVWKGTWEMIKSHPVMGTGWGTFETAYPPYRPEALMLNQKQRSYEVEHAHNWVLEWVAETGFVGLGLLLFFVAAVCFQWWKLYAAKAIPAALGAAAAAVFAGVKVDNFFDVNSTLASTLVPLLFVSALPVALSNRFVQIPGFPVRAKIWNLKDYKIYLAPVTLLIVLLMMAGVNRAMDGQITGAILKKAEAYSQASQWDQAINLYTRAIHIDPSNVEAIYFRGASYLDRDSVGDAGLALADFEVVQTLKPDYVLTHFKKALALKKLNRLPEAQVEMNQAVLLDPELIDQDPDFLKAEGMVSKRDYKKALPLYQKLVLDYPACVPLLINTANTMVECGLTAPALDLYNRVLVYDPDNSDALSNSAAVKKMKD